MAGSVLIDTWGWLALGHRRDALHREVKAFYQTLSAAGDKLSTTDYILDEVITLLFRRERTDEALLFMTGIFHSAQTGHLAIERITSQRFSAAWDLRKKFQDKPRLSFTDLTSIALIQERKIESILTDDDHFLHVGLNVQKVP